ncbi:unnamed protein product [Auanema sp. JU1783]|nr:unnamed protein product [Auanema sp. JU1783]
MEDDDMGMPSGKYARMEGDEMGENKERFARENHSEIERRRRNKMTHYINELAEMVPQCAALGRKPDKLTILRMAVSHMKQIRGPHTDETSYKPSFLSDQELKHLILEAANGFLFVVCCQTGRVLYVADSIQPVLNLKQEDWLHHNLSDLIHPDDQDKIRDQLCGGEVAVNKVLDLKTGTVKREGSSTSRVHMSCRRGFICRMRVGSLEPLHRIRNRRPIFQHGGHNYVVMHCTGYVKNTPPSGLEGATSSCLVAIARLQVASMPMCPDPTASSQFSVRIADDGKMTFIDSRATNLLGLSVDQLLGGFWWQLAHPADEQTLRDGFNTLMRDQQVRLNVRIRTSTDYLPCSISAYKFLNPYSEVFEYVVATHQIISSEDSTWQEGAIYPQATSDFNHPQNEWRPEGARDASTWPQWDQTFPHV